MNPQQAEVLQAALQDEVRTFNENVKLLRKLAGPQQQLSTQLMENEMVMKVRTARAHAVCTLMHMCVCVCACMCVHHACNARLSPRCTGVGAAD